MCVRTLKARDNQKVPQNIAKVARHNNCSIREQAGCLKMMKLVPTFKSLAILVTDKCFGFAFPAPILSENQII